MDPDADVALLTGRCLELVRTAFRVRVQDKSEGLVVRVPDHVAEALALADQVVARTQGLEYSTPLRRPESTTWVSIDAGTGLGAGDETDLYLGVDL